jgi:hypothetical protein
VGLSWGLPHALHPDEMNMVIAMMGLECPTLSDIASCMNPHFFAYGQPPLYIGYVLVWIMKLFTGNLASTMSYSEATIALRFLAAICSLITVWFMWKIVKELGVKSKELGKKMQIITFFIIAIFTPGLIQFAHFGTTESMLMACYTAITYYLLNENENENENEKWKMEKLAVIAGVAIATKVSSVLFLATIIISYFVNSIYYMRQGRDSIALFVRSRMTKTIKNLLMLFGIVAVTALILSPHSIINWHDFVSTISYESAVGMGNVKVFYTNQFENTVPIIFQFMHIFPYSLGFWQVLAFIIGFIILPYNRQFNTLRLAFLVFFIPSAFLYAKWVRFVAPVMPIMLIFSVFCTSLIYSRVKQKIHPFVANTYLILVLGFVVFQGLQFVSIYIKPDIRFEASEWVNINVPAGSFILSEERNVSNTPIENENDYKIINFDFYDYADNQYLGNYLDSLIKRADYIIVPSRRVFANYANDKYPNIKKYYQDLNNGTLGFKLVKEFKPTLLDDETSEETFTVFDHPVIRIYKRI